MSQTHIDGGDPKERRVADAARQQPGETRIPELEGQLTGAKGAVLRLISWLTGLTPENVKAFGVNHPNILGPTVQENRTKDAHVIREVLNAALDACAALGEDKRSRLSEAMQLVKEWRETILTLDKEFDEADAEKLQCLQYRASYGGRKIRADNQLMDGLRALLKGEAAPAPVEHKEDPYVFHVLENGDKAEFTIRSDRQYQPNAQCEYLLTVKLKYERWGADREIRQEYWYTPGMHNDLGPAIIDLSAKVIASALKDDLVTVEEAGRMLRVAMFAAGGR